MGFLEGKDAMSAIDGLELTRRWAERNNVPVELLLLRLGNWVDAGVFGRSGFVDRFGLPLDNGAAARSFGRLAAAPDRDLLRREEYGSPAEFSWPFVQLEALGTFCKATDTQPPPGILEDSLQQARHPYPPLLQDTDSQHVEAAVSWFERLVEEVAEGKRGPGKRLECAKREARVLARSHRRAIGDDSFWNRYKVAKSRVHAPDKVSPDLYTTGFPGRPPKLKHLIEQEFRRRAEAGEVCSPLAAEVRALRDWAVERHPDAPPPSEKTIANNIRYQYRPYASRGAQN
jgi:hypothetical protein